MIDPDSPLGQAKKIIRKNPDDWLDEIHRRDGTDKIIERAARKAIDRNEVLRQLNKQKQRRQFNRGKNNNNTGDASA